MKYFTVLPIANNCFKPQQPNHLAADSQLPIQQLIRSSFLWIKAAGHASLILVSVADCQFSYRLKMKLSRFKFQLLNVRP